MDKTISENYEDIYQQNLALLEMARQGEWQSFIDLTSVYIASIQGVIAMQSDELCAHEKDKMKIILQRIMDNETIIVQEMNMRLNVLRQGMSALNVGSKCNQAYTTSFTSTLQ